MANSVPPKILTGTIGELIVQLRLLEFGVQASPPSKDTGNDLIAIKGRCIKLIQVKTNTSRNNKKRIYDILARVILKYSEDGRISFDATQVFFTFSSDIIAKPLTNELINQIWT
ncbi:MAG: hypothetical protein PHS79_03420 [Patescibacteria group bacterium]|nr:hypothetical protein [Patescibacteria group bacterium]